MKTKNHRHTLSRQQMFRQFFTASMIDVAGKLWDKGPKGNVGGYRWPANRKRVRELARKTARLGMKAARRGA